MWKKLLRPVCVFLTISAVASVVGQIIAVRLSRGDEGSDEFQIAAICGGKKFQSRAEHLRSGSVVASMGGIDLDLRDATLDPAGASLDVRATMGGVQVIVPETWAVDVESSALAGGFEFNVTPPEKLPDDAPRLHVRAVVRMGGALVTNGADG
jgi:hypothetical protein